MEKFYLGVAREIITPEIGGQLYGYRPDIFSKIVNDNLNVTAFYFEQGETKALMISAEVCLIQTEFAEKLLQSLEEKFGISKKCIMLNATHTHSGPNTAGETGWGDIDTAYCEGIFVPMIFEAVAEAIESRRPVKMAVSQGESLVGVNRCEISKETGKIIFGQCICQTGTDYLSAIQANDGIDNRTGMVMRQNLLCQSLSLRQTCFVSGNVDIVVGMAVHGSKMALSHTQK